MGQILLRRCSAKTMGRLVALMALLAAAGSARAADVLRQGAQVAKQRNQGLLQGWQKVRPGDVKRMVALGGISARVHEVELHGGDLFIVRAPHRGSIDGLRKGGALQVLAAQFGAEEIVGAQGSARATFHIGDSDRSIAARTDIMVVEHTGRSFLTADSDAKLAGRLPEHLRLVGAVMDFLSEHTDRKLQNLMVNAEDRSHVTMRLIDHDGTFGAAVNKKLVYASAFYPGYRAGYTSQQRSIQDLDSELRVVVEAIANADLETIGQIYGLQTNVKEKGVGKVDQRQRMQTQAQSIVQLGLTNAISNYLQQFEGRLRQAVRGQH